MKATKEEEMDVFVPRRKEMATEESMLSRQSPSVTIKICVCVEGMSNQLLLVKLALL